ncbi:MAG: hypothetical protein MJ162_01800 [Treponema sp.]|nr:hypothetical protein [Treponema sp.]
MKKFLLTLGVTALLFTSCIGGAPSSEDNSTPSNPVKPEEPVMVTLSELKNSVWFSGDSTLQFPYQEETLYIKYMPDGLVVTQWISLSEKENGNFEARIEWSSNVREIGKKSPVSITKTGNLLNISSDLFNFSRMTSYKGVTASAFNPDEVPAIKSEYLSNFSGSYTLINTKYTLSIEAKLGISASVNNYWNANVVNTEVLEDGTYDMLLAHSSSKNGSGSIDPGITGNELFINRQGIFWSHLQLSHTPGSVWTIKWNSEWSDMPYDALKPEMMDMEDTFIGPDTTVIHYKYTFRFGNPEQNESGYGVHAVVPEGVSEDNIAVYEYDSLLQTEETWKQIYAHVEEAVTIPEGWLLDYWWYNNGGLGNLNSEVYKLADNTEPSLDEYVFYCALKEKPSAVQVYYQEGHYKHASKDWDLTVTSKGITYNGKEYSYVAGTTWSDSETEGLPLSYCYLLTDGKKNYFAMIEWYTNKINSSTGSPFNYVNLREPMETERTEVYYNSTESGGFGIFGTRRSTLIVQSE